MEIKISKLNNFFTIGFRAKNGICQGIGIYTQGIQKSVHI
jgi:hypothetical protein